MDSTFGFGRPTALAGAMTLPNSAPGLATALAASLFQPERRDSRESRREAARPPQPANDRDGRVGGLLSGIYRFGAPANCR
jgi:hypothetical protein